LKGLEVTVLPFSELENLLTIGAEYYGRAYVADQRRLEAAGFSLATLEEVCTLITDGDHGVADYQEEGIPFILSENVKEGWIDTGGVRYISQRHHNSLARSKILNGDVLVTKTGVYFGKSAVVDEQLGEANTIAHVGILRLAAGHDPYVLSTFLNCRYGQAQLRRRGIKATRPEIKLVEFQDILAPGVSAEFTKLLRAAIQRSKAIRREVECAVQAASSALLDAIGLAYWTPPEPLTYTARASDASAAGRLDARFYAPRIRALLDILSKDKRSVGDVAQQRREKFRPDTCVSFDYIEISDMDGAGAATSTRIVCSEAPSRATWHVRPDDIITSTVRPIRRLSAQIAPEQNGFVCSSGFVVVEPEAIASEVLLTYLRLPVISELLDLFASASMYPAITEDDIFNLPLPHIPDDVAADITRSVRDAKAARARAAAMLDAAKRAVEIAIEDSEAAAMAYLSKAVEIV